ncbi:MAG: hypothetical protein H7842_08270 [Gammaproteobacteria bacterium SHHR-1]|uniref:hypothetical protein n=1 Tax=Magnetovirga frankeli TaxID=947516 RepID=UPI001293F9D1|nr:hypothetical protein D5125_11920 [gamma proteobacterium SS-5]
MNNITNTVELNSFVVNQLANPVNPVNPSQGNPLGRAQDPLAEGEDKLTLKDHALQGREEMSHRFSEAISNARARTAVLVESFREGKSPFDLEAMVRSKDDVERILAS